MAYWSSWLLKDTNGTSDGYAAIAQVDQLRQEPESLRKWREEQKARLEELGDLLASFFPFISSCFTILTFLVYKTKQKKNRQACGICCGCHKHFSKPATIISLIVSWRLHVITCICHPPSSVASAWLDHVGQVWSWVFIWLHLDAASKAAEAEWKEKARKELEDWHHHQSEQLEKNKANNRYEEAEPEFFGKSWFNDCRIYCRFCVWLQSNWIVRCEVWCCITLHFIFSQNQLNILVAVSQCVSTETVHSIGSVLGNKENA